LEDTLRENRIHCSNPENFNDPWDCRPYFDSASVNDPSQRPRWIEFIKEQFAALTTAQQDNILQQLGVNWYEDTRLLMQSVEKMTPSVHGINSDRYRIFCLTPHANSLLMWAHYAEKHQGICLELDATKEKVWRARRVVYRDALAAIDINTVRNPPALLEAVLLTKSREWCYENEYRLLGRDGDPSFSLATEGDLLELPKGAITAVIAGSRTKHLAEIRQIARKYGVPVKLAVQRPHEYHLDIVDEGAAAE
jgi:hypothetical protein